MKTVVTLLIGALGGVLAFYANLPIPWLMGSLLAMVLFRRFSFLQQPPKHLSSWMRILFGFSLGAAFNESFSVTEPYIITTILISVTFVFLVTLFGYFYFKRIDGFNTLDSFMSALPGGVTFLLSLSEKLGDRFPKIALIHSIRMVSLLIFFSLFAFFLTDESANPNNEVIWDAFKFQYSSGLLLVFLFAVFSGIFSKLMDIAGGDIIFPMVISAVCYKLGLVEAGMPELIVTVAMITFGCVVGCKLNKAINKDLLVNIKASLYFTAAIMLVALVLSVGLGIQFDKSFFLFLLALAPCSVPEICAIALSLGFDVGFVALIHTFRYVFIMLIGSIGCHSLLYLDRVKQKLKVAG